MAKIELPNQQLHEAVSLRRRISIVLRLLLSCVYLSSCFSYQNNPQEISDFEELANLKQEKDRYCTQLSLKFDNREYAHPLPSMFTEYGKCLEQGFMVTAKSSENMKVILPDAGKAISLYNAAAQCLDREAIEVLKSKGLPVPPFSGREEGIYFFPLSVSRDQDCGFHEKLTVWGNLIMVPIAIPVGAVILVGALLTPVVCALTSPFHHSRCM